MKLRLFTLLIVARKLKNIAIHQFRLRRRNVHQTYHSTQLDRYPQVYQSALEKCLTDKPTILSFGCSTGEELLDLTNYFPQGRIIGVDISDRVVRQARKRCANLPQIEIFNGNNIELEDYGPFDVIFAMAVFCRHPATKNVANCSDIYPFSVFNDAVGDLGGFLVEGV
jgi:SAM-dependent methyltransferase